MGSFCTSCVENLTFTIVVQNPAITPDPPEDASFVSESINNARAKVDHKSKNIISWKGAKDGPVAKEFIIFQNKGLTIPIAAIPNDGRSHFKFKDVIRKRNKKHCFYIVAVGEDGSFSTPAVAKKARSWLSL